MSATTETLLPAGWYRFHQPPRKARSRSTPRAEYLFRRSRERYLADPVNAALERDVARALGSGSFGVWDHVVLWVE